MLAGHMDEIGFMVKYITKAIIRFIPLGRLMLLLGQRVVIFIHILEKWLALLGQKPPHLLPV